LQKLVIKIVTIKTTVTKKQRKYQNLAFEIKQQWQLNEIIVIPLVLPATGVMPNVLNQSRTALNLPVHLLSRVQKVAVINPCSIVR
jgi:hypothetical protein